MDEQLSLRIVRHAIDEGINFLDNSWDDNGGASEIRTGKALRDGYRDRVFLMTKIDGRSKREAARQLDESLRRLQTDHIDLVQHHEVIRFDDPHRVFDEEGSNAALIEARQAGKLRYIGFTGHKDPQIHLHILEVASEHGFTFDTAQMPLNVMDALPQLQEAGRAGARETRHGRARHEEHGRRIILKSNAVTAVECLRYALNLPTSVVITGCDSMKSVGTGARGGKTFRAMSEAEVDAAREDRVGRGAQRVRAVQNELDLRYHCDESGFARRGAAARARHEAGVSRPC